MIRFLIALLVIGVISGCLKGNSGGSYTCNYNECSVVAPASEIDSVKAYLATHGITATQHCSGLFYTIDVPGTGTKPTVCNYIAVTYQGTLTNGTVFDSSSTPVVFALSGVIRGFQNGIPLIKTGGRIHLYVPPTLGYGSVATDKIPANSILIFDVSLAGVQ